MKLLVTTSRSVLLLDIRSGAFHPIHQGAGLYYGITATHRHYLVAARRRMVSSTTPAESERGEIIVFNHRFEQVDTWQAPFSLRDMHEIKWHRGYLWVTCSFDNMVAVRTPRGDWQQWYPLGEPNSAVRDINHFNSLAVEDDGLWLLAHNRGSSEILRFDMNTRALLSRKPFGCQAHNLWRVGERWCTCSSAEGAVIDTTGLRVSTGGFPRGVAKLPQGWAVGVSALAERGRRDFTDGEIVIFDRRWIEKARHLLEGEGLVLDLLPVCRVFATLSGWSDLRDRLFGPVLARM